MDRDTREQVDSEGNGVVKISAPLLECRRQSPSVWGHSFHSEFKHSREEGISSWPPLLTVSYRLLRYTRQSSGHTEDKTAN